MSRPQIVTTTVLSFADLWHVEGHVLRRVNLRDATKIVLFLSVSRVSKHWSLSIAKGADTWLEVLCYDWFTQNCLLLIQ